MLKDYYHSIDGLFPPRDVQSFDPLTGLTIIKEWTSEISAPAEEVMNEQREFHLETQCIPHNLEVQNDRELQRIMEEMFSPSEMRLMRIRHATAGAPAGSDFD
jgi:hypothetical protein